MAATLSTPELRLLANGPMSSSMPEAFLTAALNTPPFIKIPGAFNLRDIGHKRLPYLRPGLLYRSGSLAHLTDEGKAALASQLNVRLIMDMRSAREREASPTPKIPGVEVMWLGSIGEPMPIDLNDFVGETGGEKGFTKVYREVLEIHTPSIRYVLQHLRDEIGQPVLFHCTAGKDRTGVLAAILLGLAGAPHPAIAADYALTRIGIEPQKDILQGFLRKWRPEWKDDTPGMENFSEVRAEYMVAFLQWVDEKYGGMDGYVIRRLAFNKEDVEIIKGNMRGDLSFQAAAGA